MQSTQACNAPSLCNFNASHIDEDCQSISGDHENELFFNCKFKDVKNLTLKHCDLNRSQFLTDDIRDALGFTVTLDCLSFKDVELSPLMFDLLLCLLIKTKGNNEKRKKLVDAIGKQRFFQLLREMSTLEGN